MGPYSLRDMMRPLSSAVRYGVGDESKLGNKTYRTGTIYFMILESLTSASNDRLLLRNHHPLADALTITSPPFSMRASRSGHSCDDISRGFKYSTATEDRATVYIVVSGITEDRTISATPASRNGHGL